MNANDLPAKIEAIRAAGVTYTAIAKRANCDISTLFRIRQGEIPDPKYSVGSTIDAMYTELSGTEPSSPAESNTPKTAA